MGIVNFHSPAEFQKAFDERTIGGMVPLKLAGEMLGLSRARLMAIAGESDDLTLLKIKMEDTTINGLTEASVRSLAAKRGERERRLIAANEESLRNHIVESLLNNNFANDSTKLLEYGAHIMKPFGLSHQLARDRQHIGALLGTISEATLQDPTCAALLSAVVINKTGPNKGKPSAGFWNLVEGLTGKSVKKEQREAYWRREIGKLQKYIASIAKCPEATQARLKNRATPASTATALPKKLISEHAEHELSGVELPVPTKLVGSLDIGDDGDLLTIKSFIYRGDSIAFDVVTNMYGANQVMRVDGVAKLDGGIYKSTPIVPSQKGSSSKEFYRVKIMFTEIIELEEQEVFMKGAWVVIKDGGTEAYETYKFMGNLNFG
jgi:hypothetical protein